MIYSLSGKITKITDSYAVINVSGVGYKVFIPKRTADFLRSSALSETTLYTYLAVKDDALDLYGFLEDYELAFFEKLISVNGVGPKSAQGIMSISSVDELVGAIVSERVELLTRASGIGKKTAERIILELRGRLEHLGEQASVTSLENDLELEEVLSGLGYSRFDIKKLLSENKEKITGDTLQIRLKSALKLLKKQ
ncbi:MAG: Holliday junction branch migration protein RuvA [Candidatus Harrisonbacteria bacterium]|nr:Holliday junction branch migration protein RuvA [Candidatus Harrisonbacteria bacterium]